MRAGLGNGCVAKVFTSPLQRVTRTCELAGFGAVAEIDRNLLECNYGEYEGRLTTEIHKERPDWQLFRDGCPGGESPNEVGTRIDPLSVRKTRVLDAPQVQAYLHLREKGPLKILYLEFGLTRGALRAALGSNMNYTSAGRRA